MGAFVFPLERVLEHRRREEDARRAAVGALERQRLHLELQIRGRQRAIDDAKRDLRDALAGAREGAGDRGALLDVPSARLQAGATIHEAARAQQLALELAGVHLRLRKARAELLQATTRRKAVELLRRRRYDRWLREQTRRENAAMDEMGAAQWRRGQEEGATQA